MVNDYIVMITSPDGILTVIGGSTFIAETETYVSYNHIIGLDHSGVILYADAVSGCRLSGDGDIPVLYS